MRTIFTKFVPASNTKPARIKCYLSRSTGPEGKPGQSAFFSYAHGVFDAHGAAANIFATRLGWLKPSEIMEATAETPDGKGYTFTVATRDPAPPITQATDREWTDLDRQNARRLAIAKGYSYITGPSGERETVINWAWSSTSHLVGYYCLPFSPQERNKPQRGAVIIKTRECGLLIIQDFEDVTGTHESEASKIPLPANISG